MKIAVLQKIVPDTYHIWEILPDGTGLDWDANFDYVNDRHSEFAIEEAVRVKEQIEQDTTIKTFSIRRGNHTKPILKALAKGMDEAVIIENEELYHADPGVIAKGLAEELKEYDADLIIGGTFSSDENNYYVTPAIAAYLDIPIVSRVVNLEVEEDKIIAKRNVGDRTETVECSFPVLITTEKGLNEPRYPKLPEIMRAKRKPQDEKEEPAFEIENRVRKTHVEKPDTDTEGIILGEDDGSIEERVDQLIEFLFNEKKVLD